MNVPDFATGGQKLPDAELAQIISEGKGGMPSFKNSPARIRFTPWWRRSRAAWKKVGSVRLALLHEQSGWFFQKRAA